MKITDENEIKRYKLFKQIMQASTQGIDFLIHNGTIKKVEKEEDNIDSALKYFLEPHSAYEWKIILCVESGLNLFAKAYNHVHPTAPISVDTVKAEYNADGFLQVLCNYTILDINDHTYQIRAFDIKPVDNEITW